MLDRPDNLNATFIAKAFEAGDKETVIAAYLDILDYNREISSRSTFVHVLNSMEFSKHIDHLLFGHIREQMKERNYDCRIYSAAYYLQVNGALTAADLLNDIAADHEVTMIENSAMFKREFIDKIVKRTSD